ncbi:hypothetical protein ACFFRR_000661 [Megaselia abdita]
MDNNTKDESSVSMYYSFNDTGANKTLENENDENISVEILQDAILQGRVKSSPLRPLNVLVSSTPTKNSLPKPGDLRKSVLQDLKKAFNLTINKEDKLVVPPVYEDISVELIEVSDNDSTLQKLDVKDISEIIVILQEKKEDCQKEVKEDVVGKEKTSVKEDVVGNEKTSVKENVVSKEKEEKEASTKVEVSSQKKKDQKDANLKEIPIELKEEQKTPIVQEKESKVSPEEHFEMIAQGMLKKEVKFVEETSNSDNIKQEKMGKSTENKKLRKSIIPRRKSVVPDDQLSKKPTPPMSLGKSSKVPRFAISYEEKKTMTTTSSKKPFQIMSRSTRMSILKTTLNSPARRDSLRNHDNSIIKISSKKSTARFSIAPSSSGRKSISRAPTSRKSVVPTKTLLSRKSVFPTTNGSTMNSRRSVAPLSFTSRRSVAPPAFSSRKSVLPTKTTLPKPTKTISSQKPEDISSKTYTCQICSRKFLVESLFLAHKKSHDKATKQNIADNKTCKYCDKKFQIEKALENHLLEKCPKIPTAEKKKLLFPDLNKKKVSTPSTSILSDDSLSSTVNKTVISTTDKEMMPPSVNKVKKATAHSGIYRTPTKRIDCKLCKLSFGSCLEFTEHCLSHGGDHSKISLDRIGGGDQKKHL